jgi:Transposase IS200 like
MNSGAAFVWMDRYLDSACTGPMYLGQKSIPGIVLASLERGVALGHYDLAAYAVLSNHVHLLLLPQNAPSRLLQSRKGMTAREANRILGRTGESFWQAESYDHWVRDEGEWQRIATYIEDSTPKITHGRAHLSEAQAPRRVSALQTRVSAPRRSRVIIEDAPHFNAYARSAVPRGSGDPPHNRSEDPPHNAAATVSSRRRCN